MDMWIFISCRLLVVVGYNYYPILFNRKLPNMMQNTTSPRPKKATQQKISLFNILTCLLCQTKAKMAHICPNCSKFYCECCIKQWMRLGNQQCPNCHNVITQNTIVNCNKLSQDLSNALQALIQLQNPQEIQCQTHSIPQTYYCQQCTCTICSDCIVLETKHRGHTIFKLSKIKMEFNQQVLAYLAKLRKYMKELDKNKQNTIMVKNHHADQIKGKIDRLNGYVEKMRIDYELNLNSAIQRYEVVLNQGKLIQISGNKIYEQFLNQVKEFSKVELVRKGEEKLEEIKSMSLKDNQKFVQKEQMVKIRQKAEINIVSQKFPQHVFVLPNYTQSREKKEVIYTDSFFSGPLEWRLKIYPNGLQKKLEQPVVLKRCNSSSNFSTEEYISIYIELVSGVREAGRYQFNIGIVSEGDQSKVISQVYEADFDVIKCWGYDEFANISTLYQKGYINSESDSLKISVSVGPPSFYYSMLDQQAIIAKKQQKINQNKNRIEELKNAIKIKNQRFMVESKQNLSANEKVEQANERKTQELNTIKTPRCRVPPQVCKSSSINYQNYVIQLPQEEPMRGTEEFDHQSAELRKIFRRLSQINEKNSLLLF